MPCLLSTAYFPPIQWFSKVRRYEHCLVEQHDHYVKQTYRNRCTIMTWSGPLSLTVPVERSEGKLLMRDVRISDHNHWRHIHWNALESAYGETPFFEYYADDLLPFFDRRWDYLFDFNMAIANTLCQLLDLREADLQPTTHYIPGDSLSEASVLSRPSCLSEASEFSQISEPSGSLLDFRETIRPKHAPADPTFVPRPYWQVHGQRFGFTPGLSILDLLFTMGPESILYL